MDDITKSVSLDSMEIQVGLNIKGFEEAKKKLEALCEKTQEIIAIQGELEKKLAEAQIIVNSLASTNYEIELATDNN